MSALAQSEPLVDVPPIVFAVLGYAQLVVPAAVVVLLAVAWVRHQGTGGRS